MSAVAAGTGEMVALVLGSASLTVGPCCGFALETSELINLHISSIFHKGLYFMREASCFLFPPECLPTCSAHHHTPNPNICDILKSLGKTQVKYINNSYKVNLLFKKTKQSQPD